MQRLGKSGQLIPMILIAMVIMAILGIAVLFSGSADYAQSALVVYGLKTQQLALAALDEVQLALYDSLNAPSIAPSAFKKKLLAEIRSKVSAGNTKGWEENLAAMGMAARATALAKAAGGTIDSVVARFYGFRRIKYQIVKGTSDDLFASELVYYHDPTKTFDKSLQTPEDYVGWYSLTVKATYAKIARQLTVTHDMKVVDVSPVARQFALFSYGTTAQDQPNPPPPDYANTDLNKGGGFKVFASGAGRVFVRGPFSLEPEDVKGGWGGKEAPFCTTYPVPPPKNPGDAKPRRGWHGWAAVPAIRDGMMDRAGFSFASIGVGPRRPDRQKDWALVTDRIVGALTGSALSALLNRDPGWFLLTRGDPPTQWFSGTRDVDPQNRAFSIAGDPNDDANGGFVPFMGLVWKYTDKREFVGDGLALLGPSRSDWVPPADQDVAYSIEPEGGLVGLYNRNKFDRWNGGGFDSWRDWYEVTPMGQVQANYGYRWEKAYERGWLDKTLGDLIRYGPVLMFSVVGIATVAAVGLMDTLGLVPFGAPQAPVSLVNVKPDDVKNVFPTNFRPYERATTRRHGRLKDLPSIAGKRPVPLDGVIWVDDLSTASGFRYKGRGIIHSPGTKDSKEMKVNLPIVPAVPAGADFAKAEDYLTFVYSKDEDGKTHTGDCQIEFFYTPEAGDKSGSVLQGSVLSVQGVRADRGQKVSIAGNFVCSFINKQRIPDDARINVRYNADMLGGVDPNASAKFGDGSWTVLAVSPRVAGWYDK